MSRILCQFSCGAPSAVATKLVLAENPSPEQRSRVLILNAYLKEEHPDNRRFLADCERWFGHPVTQLCNDKYDGSAREVFRRRRYMNGLKGAPCSRELKRKLLDSLRLPGDVMILGYDASEADRFELFKDFHPDVIARAPLIEKGLSKPDCKALIDRAGIELPMMYRMGYDNANCIGCVKGGEGYWNKIRRDFPADFAEMVQIQESIGPSAYLFRDRETGERYSLRNLDPKKGRYRDEQPISCSFFCELAEKDFEE